MLNICPNMHGNPVWIDLFDPTPDESERVRAKWHVHIPSRATLEEIESSSRLSLRNGEIHMSMPVVAHRGEEMPTPLGFVLTKDLVLTVRYTPLHGFARAIEHFNKDGAKTSTEAFATLIEGIIDYAADALEQIGLELNGVSRRVFRNYGTKHPRNIARSNRALRETLVAVGECGEKLSQIRESLLGLQRMVPYAMENSQ